MLINLKEIKELSISQPNINEFKVELFRNIKADHNWVFQTTIFGIGISI